VSSADLATTCFAVQLLVGAILLIGEATGRLRLPYGKFRTGAGVNSRAGLALAYATPVFVYIVLWVEGGSPRTLYHLAVFGAFLFHFLRRIFEVSFVNSYSRPTPLRALMIIAFLYGGVAASCAFFQVRTFGQPTSQPIFTLGILIFALGEVLNGYHHWLLARLRPLGVRIYVVPRHGLFGWVACPHYLGEILSFVGYAMMSDLLPVWGNALVTSAYLSARANSTLNWYRLEMPLQIPSGWRRLIPFVTIQPAPLCRRWCPWRECGN
jgi:3-oxo-5-alpha-steroid 4-dehydrogenase